MKLSPSGSAPHFTRKSWKMMSVVTLTAVPWYVLLTSYESYCIVYDTVL